MAKTLHRRSGIVMLIDIFPFFNELDILELRLHELDDVVDHFIAVQAEETHSGLPKPVYFNPQDDRWFPWRNRISTVVLPRCVDAPDRWWRENATRKVIPVLLNHNKMTDLVLMSDVDEIPDHHAVAAAVKLIRPRRWVGFRTACYYYYLNLRTPRSYKCIALTTAGYVCEVGGQHFRDKAHRPPIGPIDGGWHFSYMGGVEAIRMKLASFAHDEFDTDEIKNPERLAQCVAERRSFFPRHAGKLPPHSGQFFQVPITELPTDVQQRPEHYARHLLP